MLPLWLRVTEGQSQTKVFLVDVPGFGLVWVVQLIPRQIKPTGSEGEKKQLA